MATKCPNGKVRFRTAPETVVSELDTGGEDGTLSARLTPVYRTPKAASPLAYLEVLGSGNDVKRRYRLFISGSTGKLSIAEHTPTVVPQYLPRGSEADE